MRPWVTKKIAEYLGEEEKTLTDFIMTKVAQHCSPTDLLGQLQLVLDEEAEVFVMKLWRLLIFELLRLQAAGTGTAT
jgi:RNA-binding protein 25